MEDYKIYKTNNSKSKNWQTYLKNNISKLTARSENYMVEVDFEARKPPEIQFLMQQNIRHL